MNPADPPTPDSLDPAQRIRVLIVVILLLFGIEKLVESATEKRFKEKARQGFENLDRGIRSALYETSPWFVYHDFFQTLDPGRRAQAAPAKFVPAAPSLAAASSEPLERAALADTSFQLKPRNLAEVEPLLLLPKTGQASSNPGGMSPSPGAEYAMRLAEEQQRAESAAAAEKEFPKAPAVNPLLLPLRAPGALVSTLGRAATRGPGHFLVLLLATFAAWRIVRPDEGWRWWLLILVPVLGGGIIAALYFLCQGASAALGWALHAPSVPLVLATAFAIIKIPINMAIEKKVHGSVVRLGSLFRR